MIWNWEYAISVVPQMLRAFIVTLEATLAGLGLDDGTSGEVILDAEARPRKSPRAFCSPVHVPDEAQAPGEPREPGGGG